MTRQEYTVMINILNQDEDWTGEKTFKEAMALWIEARVLNKYLQKHPYEAHKPYKMSKLQRWVHKKIGLLYYPIKVE